MQTSSLPEYKLEIEPGPFICYQCDEYVVYLFADARCSECTHLTPEEVRGDT